MKKAFVIACAASFCTAALHAQTDSSRTQPVRTDKYNNIPADKYKLAPLPDGLTNDKVFPAIGTYSVTDKEGVATDVTITQDPENKGTVWVEGLPAGKIKANLRQSPAIYKIPAQKVGDDMDVKNQKDVAEGVLIYDKDNNTLNICIGCKYNVETPEAAFNMAEQTTETVATNSTKTKTKSTVKKAPKVKTWYYSGAKQIETAATVTPTPMQ